RTAAFAKVLLEAASTDREIAAILEATRERRRRDVVAAIALVVGSDANEVERDGVWALTSPEVYLLLIESSGWTIDRYEAWMAETLDRVLPPSSKEGRAPR